MRPSGLIVCVCIALVLGLYQIARHAYGAIRPKPIELDAVQVSRHEQPEIWRLADSVARRLEAQLPDNILAALERTSSQWNRASVSTELRQVD